MGSIPRRRTRPVRHWTRFWIAAGFVALYLVFLVFLAMVAFGAPEPFPFKTTEDKFEDHGFTVMQHRTGNCTVLDVILVQLINKSETVGWQLWFVPNQRLVAVRYDVQGGKGQGTEIYFAKIDGDNIVVKLQRPFDSEHDQSPCPWLVQSDV